MRSFIAAVIVAGAVVSGLSGFAVAAKDKGVEGTVTISGAWALYPMTVKWAEEFQKLHPGVKFDISAGGAGKGLADALAGVVDIGMVSRGIYQAEIDKGAWWISVTKDAVVATVNEKNPVLTDIITRGMNRETLVGIWITENVRNWGQAVGSPGAQKYPIRVYTRSDACGAAKTWAEYLGKDQEDLAGIGVYGDPGLAEAVKKDVLGIGFNNIGYAYDAKTKKPIEGIRVLPLDVNADGKIGKAESFYDSRDSIAAAILDGRYPSPPARELNFVCSGLPKREMVIAFMKWVLTDGQKYVAEAGYINLPEDKLKHELGKLAP